MKITRILRRTAVVATATFGLVLPNTSAAHAVGIGIVSPAAGECGSSQVCTGVGQGQIVGLSSLDIAAECSVSTPFAAAATSVGCSLVGADGVTYASSSRAVPGVTATTPLVAANVPLQNYVLCVSGGWTGLDGSLQSNHNPLCG